MERKKIVHVLDTPYTAVEWPQVSQEDQDVILELLCRLLAPLGTHRRSFITPSKGKRRRTRKKENAPSSEPPAEATPAPPAPELAAHVDVGLSKISRTLQLMSAKKDGVSSTPGEVATQYSVVFVARSGQSSAFHCHFPQMVALAAQSQSPEKAVRLVGFSKSCEERLSAALGIPRASSIGLRDDEPQAKGLIDFVREHVAPVQVSWLEEACSARFLETNIDAVPTKVGSKKPRLS
ncbi:RNase P and RNase MRP subunit [Madurella fahalii]|uniref:RNase P and RNase MRP subunit n=1 Tax=Madurella fahalii TaxID=1157608 RepID=A0ABQ0GS16_9PEZI